MRWMILVGTVLACVAAVQAAATTNSGAAPGRAPFVLHNPSASPLAKIIGTRADAALDAAAAGDDAAAWTAAEDQARGALALAVAFGTSKDVPAFVEADYARRLLCQLEPLDPKPRHDLLLYLRKHDDLGHLIAFTLRDGNDPAAAYQLLDTLRQQRPAQVDAQPNLTVAFCVVRDRPFLDNLNGKKATPPEPLALFDYYIAHEHSMVYSLHDMPVELLERVVDFTGSMDDLKWALQHYAGNPDVGRLYGQVPYDTDFYEGKSPDKLIAAGLTLENVLKVGGVCIDRAWFSAEIGKAIGVPTVIDHGHSADAGHAWVGFLQMHGKSADWNFDSGRFGVYMLTRGGVRDPQEKTPMPDGTAALVSDVIGTTATQRQAAVALVDAARMLLGTNLDEPPADPDEGPRMKQLRAAEIKIDPTLGATAFVAPAPPVELPKSLAGSLGKPRAATSDGALELIDLSLRQYASCTRAWQMITTLAATNQLTDKQKQTWADLTQKLCGQKHPDFALDILEPMIRTVTDPTAQSAMWDAEFAALQKRLDLAARVRLEQAAMWESRGDLKKAGMCYEDVIHRYINDGPFALKAVQGAENVLTQMNEMPKILDLYALAYKLVERPDPKMGPDFVRGSNWFKVKGAYAKKLDAAGQTQLAAAVRADGAKPTDAAPQQ
jgi:hypothetical protein